MSKKITVTVTANDIKASKKALKSGEWRTTCCPVAQALRRRWPDAGVGTTNFTKGSGLYQSLPKKAMDFIYDYDQGVAVKPFRFTLWV